MKLPHLAFALSALALLGACATATPYQEAANSGQRGYENIQIEQDRWTVSFAGNSLTDRQTVETYLLFRAAELTRQEGYDHFRVVQRSTDENRRVLPSGLGPRYSSFYCNYNFYGRHGRLIGYPRGFYGRAGFGRSFHSPFYDDFGYREVVRYEANSEIVMGRGAKPSDPAYFSADDVLTNLADKITRPETSA